MVKIAGVEESNGEGLRGSPIHAPIQGILGDIMTRNRPAPSSIGQEQYLPIPRPVIESSQRPTAVIGEKLSRKSRLRSLQMDGWRSRALLALVFAMMMVPLVGAQSTEDATPPGEVAAPEQAPANAPDKPLALLKKDKALEIDHIQLHGATPKLIYIPIVHDNPEHRHAAGGTQAIEKTLVRCRTIAEHLYTHYGVRNVLLEGLSKTVADKYNSPKHRGRKLPAGESKLVTLKVWYDLLNAHQWHLVPASEENTYGPLTLLGHEYTVRIQKAFEVAKQKGWFRSHQAVSENQTEFTALISKARKGYNARLDALLLEDPGLKKEYDITVVQRNKAFIENAMATQGPTIIMCGGGHIQDLIEQLNRRKVAHMIVVPKGIAWPPVKTDDEAIYRDMRKLGCQLRSCILELGDGTRAKVKIDIK